MDIKMYLKVVFMLYLASTSQAVSFSSKSENHELLVTQGRMQYEVLSVDSRMPRYGPCWKSALAQLENGCSNLDDEVQSRLALNFANCFLEKAGLRTYPCESDMSISECLVNIDNNAFTTYSNFFTHTHNMCYFLQSQVWHEETENTVERLAVNSDKVSRAMEHSHKLQDEILRGQQDTLDYHKQLLENGSYLSQAIEASKDNVRDILAEFKTSTDEQKNLIFEVFDRVSRLQNLVVSEVNWLYTVVFYGAALLVIYIVTATKRTADARLLLFAVLSVNLCVERMVCNYSLPSDHSKVVTEITETVYGRIWFVRQIALGLCMLVLSVYAFMFKDYNVINNTLLQEIKKQNLDLKQSMQMFQVGNRQHSRGPGADMLDGPSPLFSSSISALLAEDTGFQGDEEEDDDDFSDDDSDSFNSTRTDATWSGNWSDDEFDTAENSREQSGNVTPTNKEIDSAMVLLSDRLITSLENHPSVLECSSPAIKPVSNQLKPVSNQLMTPQSKRRGRPPGPRSQTPTPDPDRYMLRSRRPSSGLGNTNNPSLEQETAEDFAKVVKKQLGTTRRNYSKWQLALNKHQEQQGEFSSDE